MPYLTILPSTSSTIVPHIYQKSLWIVILVFMKLRSKARATLILCTLIDKIPTRSLEYNPTLPDSHPYEPIQANLTIL